MDLNRPNGELPTVRHEFVCPVAGEALAPPCTLMGLFGPSVSGRAALRRIASDRRLYRRIRRAGACLPILDHKVEFFHDGIDFLEIFAASFLRFEIQCATEGDHIPQVTNMTGR